LMRSVEPTLTEGLNRTHQLDDFPIYVSIGLNPVNLRMG